MKYADIIEGQKVIVIMQARLWGECTVIGKSPPNSIIVKDEHFGKNHFVPPGGVRLSKAREHGFWVTTDRKTDPPTINVLIRIPASLYPQFEAYLRDIEAVLSSKIEVVK